MIIHRLSHGILFFLVLLPLALTGCGTVSAPRGDGTARDGAPSQKIDIASIPDAVPRHEPRSKYGNPATYAVAGKSYQVMADNEGYQESGIASWYGTKFHGRRTSSGEPYDMHGMTAAHKTLPLPTYAEITNLQNGRKITVKINDRGPFHENRLIDLSYAAASKLGILATGTGLVKVRAITPSRTPQCGGCTDAQEPPPGRTPQCGGWPLPASMPSAALAHPCAAQDAQEPPPDAPTTPAITAAERQGSANDASRAVKVYLQVGAFRNRDNAEQLRVRIDGARGHEKNGAGAASVQIIEGELYRVRIGPFAKVEEVDRFTRGLQKLGIRDTQVIID